MAQQQIVFRHINGRIVPIKSAPISKEDRKKSAVQGSAQVATGIAAAAAPAVVAAKVAKKAYEFKVKSRIMTENIRATKYSYSKIKEARKTAAELRLLSTKMFKHRSKLALAGAAISTGLITKGVHNLHEAISGQQQEYGKTEKTLGAVGPVIAAATYYKVLPIKGFKNILQNVSALLRGKPRPHVAEWYK